MSDDERANVPPDQRAGGNNDIPMSFSHSKPLPEIPMSRTEIEAYEVELKAELEQNVSKLNSKPLGELIYANADGTLDKELFNAMVFKIKVDLNKAGKVATSFPPLSVACEARSPIPKVTTLDNFLLGCRAELEERETMNPNIITYMRDGGARLDETFKQASRVMWLSQRVFTPDDIECLTPAFSDPAARSYYKA